VHGLRSLAPHLTDHRDRQDSKEHEPRDGHRSSLETKRQGALDAPQPPEPLPLIPDDRHDLAPHVDALGRADRFATKGFQECLAVPQRGEEVAAVAARREMPLGPSRLGSREVALGVERQLLSRKRAVHDAPPASRSIAVFSRTRPRLTCDRTVVSDD
jgi:hypothetical protein